MNVFTKFLLAILVIDLSLLFFNWRYFKNNSKETSLIIGILGGYPYASINPDGTLEGFDIDLAYLIAKKLDKPIKFKDMPYGLLRTAIKIGQIDIIGFSVVITHKSLQSMDMIDVYGKPKAEMTFIFWQNIPAKTKTMKDIKKQSLTKPIAMRAESEAWMEALEVYGITNIMTLEQYHDWILPLQYGQAFAAVVGPRHALSLQKQYPEIKILKIPLDKPWAEGVGMGVKKGNIKLKEQLEKAVKELKDDGTIDALKKKWFGEGAQ